MTEKEIKCLDFHKQRPKVVHFTFRTDEQKQHFITSEMQELPRQHIQSNSCHSIQNSN